MYYSFVIIPLFIYLICRNAGIHNSVLWTMVLSFVTCPLAAIIYWKVDSKRADRPIASLDNNMLTLHGLETPLGGYAPQTLPLSSIKELAIAGQPPQSLIFTDNENNEQVYPLMELCCPKDKQRLIAFLTEELSHRNLTVSECE